MKLEQNEKQLLFSETVIPDIFFTEYLSQASGDYIKVYLCLVFLAKYDKDIKLNDLSKKLNIPFATIQAALAFWEDLGVITKKLNGYVLNNLQEILILQMLLYLRIKLNKMPNQNTELVQLKVLIIHIFKE